MKKLVITSDKVGIGIFTLTIALSGVSMYLFSLDLKSAFAEYGIEINSIPIFVIGTLILLTIYTIIMKRLTIVIHLNEDSIGFGVFNLRKIEYSEIKDVNGENKLKLHLSEKIKYIDIILLEKNKSKYEELLMFLENKIEKIIYSKNILINLAQYDNEKFTSRKDGKTGIGGLLVILAIYIISNSITYILSITNHMIIPDLLIMNIFEGCVFVFSIVTIIYFFRKKLVFS